MFGQQSQPFGAPASGFGFGTTSTTFGAPATGGGLFGQSQPAQPAFGGSSTFGTTAFGQPQQAQQSNPFATTTSTGFGTAAANPFGGQQTTQPAQSSGLFGSTGLFGAPTQQPAQTAFGQPQQQTSTSLFGTSSTGGGLFGQAKTGFGASTTFGTQPASTSLFGTQQPSQSGGLFGSTASTGTTGTGLFGQQSSSSNLFGGMGQSQSGTTVKFVPTVGQDSAIKNGQQQQITTKNYCICMMKEYNEQKSQEELRWDDYQAGRKFGNATTASTGLFGATQPASNTTGTGLFGTGTSTGFGGTSGFGQPAAKPTGFGGTSSGGLFGQQPATTGFFGSSTAAPTNTGFGATSIFGQSAPATSAPSMFGSFGGLGNTATTTPAGTTGSAFGTGGFGTSSSFGGFGQPAATPATTNLFGQPAATTTASAFGSFGSGSLFGAKPVTTTASSFGGFGQPTTSSAGFGGFPALGTTQPAASTTNLFGNANKPFGAPATTSMPFGGFGTSTGFGGFGAASTTQPSTSIFGQPGATGLFGAQTQPTTSFFGSAQSTQPTGQPSSGGNIHAQVVEMLRQGVSDTEVFSNMYAHLPVKAVEKKTPLSGTTINEFITNAKRNYAPTVGSSRKDERTYNYYVAPTHKADGLVLSGGNGPTSWRPAAAKRDEKFKLDRACIEKLELEVNQSRMETPRPVGKVSQIKSSVYSAQTVVSGKGDRARTSQKTSPPVDVFNVRKAFEQAQDDTELGSLGEGRGNESGDDQSVGNESEDDENVPADQAVFILRRRDYYTVPDKTELGLNGKGQCFVKDFFVGRYQCGSVQFLGETNVAGLNLDELITISQNEVVVYPDEKRKPAVGKGLNKRAVITFENVRPESNDGRPLTKQEIIDSGFEELLRARIVSTMDDAEFLGYDAENGQVTFAVQHFSKYKLLLTKEDKTIKKSDGQLINKFEAKEKLPDIGQGRDNSLKENISPLAPGKRARRGNNEDEPRESWKSADLDDSVINYFKGLPVSPDGNDGKRMCTDDLREGPDSARYGINYRVRQPELLDDVEPQQPISNDGKRPVGLVTRRLVLEYGQGGKSVSGSLTLGYPAGVMGFLGGPDGQFLAPFSLLDDADLLTDESKFSMEEMLQLYLSNCGFENDIGAPVLIPPSIEKSNRFIRDFCQLSDRLPGDTEPAVHERVMWSLFHILYSEADLSEEEVCQKFLTWLKTTVAALQPAYPNLADIAPELVTKAIFEAVLGGRNAEAVEIALHFGLSDAASTMLALWDQDEEGPAWSGQVEQMVDLYLDQVMVTVNKNTDDSVKYWAKTLMVLRGILCLNPCTHVDKFSVCEGLDWIACLAACALHLPQEGRLTGVWDVLRKYKDHADWNSYCTLPGQVPCSAPSFIYSMLTHYCRHSMPNMSSTLGLDLLNEKGFDVRIRWFILRLYGISGDEFDGSTSMSITNDFVRSLQICGYPHVAVIALLHLQPNRARQMEINSILMSLVRLGKEQPELCQSLVTFLLRDMHLNVEDVENVRAASALSRGEKLEAFVHFFNAKNEASCQDIIWTYILPFLAAADTTVFQETLNKFTFLHHDSDWLQPFAAFFALLRVVEQWKNDDISRASYGVLDAALDVLNDSNGLCPPAGSRSKGPLEDFVKYKLRQGQAVLLAAEEAASDGYSTD